VASFCELLDQLRVERAKIIGPAALETQVEVRAGPVQHLLGLGQLHLLDHVGREERDALSLQLISHVGPL
jgi:hypothetical protein